MIHAPDGSKLSVFCHFTTQYAMTLVMSFSKQQCDVFHPYSLVQDFPKNEDAQNWSEYRLSLANMKGIRDGSSTHWMYTCSYQTRGLSEVDSLRSKFSETDILTYELRRKNVVPKSLNMSTSNQSLVRNAVLRLVRALTVYFLLMATILVVEVCQV